MKNTLLILAAITLFACNSSKNQIDVHSAKMVTQLDTISYLLGTNYGEGLRKNTGLDSLSNENFLKGMQTILDGDMSCLLYTSPSPRD